MDYITIIGATILAAIAAYNIHRANRAEAALEKVEAVIAETTWATTGAPFGIELASNILAREAKA